MAAASTLFLRATSLPALQAAWSGVRERSTEDEVERPSTAVERFSVDAPERLKRLADQLAQHTYRPGFLYPVRIPKSGGGVRTLHVPSVRDRVVERAVLDTIAPHVDPHLSVAAYAYRPGRGVADAVQAVVEARHDGFSWVLHADVQDCFPSIPRDVALAELSALLPDASLDGLIGALTSRRAALPHGSGRDVRGLAQGASLSPLLANLVLTDLDEALLAAGFHPIRYADDFVVPCRVPSDAERALQVAKAAVEEIGMALSQEKTEIMSFEEGFCFLGEDFGPRYPPLLPEHRVEEPTQRVVYAGVQGSRIFTAKGRLVVQSKNDEPLLDVPTSHIMRIVCFGSVGLSAGARSWALSQDVQMVFVSRRGTYLGQHVAAGSPTRVRRLRAQIAAADRPRTALGFAHSVIGAKIRHQVAVLQKLTDPECAEEVSDAVGQMRAAAGMLPDAHSPSETMGLEGIAAKSYFETLGSLMPEGVRFACRSRRPPQDVVNSALGYGYAILLAECVSALHACGLDPAIGMLHADQDNRPSLALDLMEEFRPYVVDLVVARLARRGAIAAEHGLRNEGVPGVLLSAAGKRSLIDGYERRMLQITGGALPNFTGSIRRHVYRQAQRLAAYVADPATGWQGLSWR